MNVSKFFPFCEGQISFNKVQMSFQKFHNNQAGNNLFWSAKLWECCHQASFLSSSITSIFALCQVFGCKQLSKLRHFEIPALPSNVAEHPYLPILPSWNKYPCYPTCSILPVSVPFPLTVLFYLNETAMVTMMVSVGKWNYYTWCYLDFWRDTYGPSYTCKHWRFSPCDHGRMAMHKDEDYWIEGANC